MALMIAAVGQNSVVTAPARTRLKFGLARRTNAWKGAFRLVHDQYVARGYMSPLPSGLRVGPHHALPSTKVFVVRDEGRVVGTVTLIQDSPLGLPMDELYGAELAGLRAEGRRLTEVSALAIDDDYKASGVSILTKLIRLVILYASEIAQDDDICFTVNPRHVRFYRRLLPHAYQIGEIKAYHKVNGAPAALLRLDVNILRDLIPVVQASGGAYEFVFRPDDFAKTVARLRREARRSRLTSRQFARFFGGYDAIASASAAERAFLRLLYRDVEPEEIHASIPGPLALALAPA